MFLVHLYVNLACVAVLPFPLPLGVVGGGVGGGVGCGL